VWKRKPVRAKPSPGGHQGWSDRSRHDAVEALRNALSGHRQLLVIAESGAEMMRELLGARSVTVSTLTEGHYQDLVNVGQLGQRDVRFPRDDVYMEDLYPVATQLLQLGKGYRSASRDDLVFQEMQRDTGEEDLGSVMGAPMVSGGIVRGEVSMRRGLDQRPFTPEDLQVLQDLATVLGSQLWGASRRAILHEQ
jgi:GAF domain-containing protein